MTIRPRQPLGALADPSRQRLEDLEEALRRIMIVLEPDGRHDVTDRDLAALAIACDVLDLDFPEIDWLAALL
jgi:hypothetical protein